MQKLHFNDDLSKYITFFGRTKKTSTGYAFYYTASGFSLKVHGQYVKLIFNSYYEEENKKAYIVIIHDGIEDVYQLGLGEQEITILTQDMTSIEVRKRSESMMSRSEIVSLETDGHFIEVEEDHKPLNITFIGDSLTCGYGNLSNDTELPFSTAYEDGLQSFASIAAKALNAEYEMVSVSGIGLYKSIYAHVTMPGIYEQIDIYDTTPYVFKGCEDIVVLNIGTNDNTYLKYLVEPTRLYEENMFLESYIRFIKRLHVLHPQAKIIAISQGSRQNHVDALIEKAVKQMNESYLVHLRISDIPVEDGMGQQFHPTVLTHQRWGYELHQFIKKMQKESSL